jgi:hypothetical protein
MKKITEAIMAIALLLLPGIGATAILADALTPTTTMSCTMMDNQSCNMSGGMMNCSQMSMTEITGTLTYDGTHYKIGSTVLDYSPCCCLSTVGDHKPDKVLKEMGKDLRKNVGNVITVDGMLSCDGMMLMLTSINGVVYRIPSMCC